MRRGGDLTEEKAGLRKGPQEYHSAPRERRDTRLEQVDFKTRRLQEEEKKLTCDPRSAVVESLEVGGRVNNVAGGKDVDTGSQLLAIITTVIYTLVTHWRHCYWIPR